MSPANDNFALARSWFDAMSGHDAKQMGALSAPDVAVMVIAEGGEVHSSREYLVWAYEDLFRGFPDCTCEIVNAFATDDRGVVEIRWRGTNTGEFRGEPASGGSADVRICYVFRFEGGQIAGITEYYDGYTVMQQLSG